MSRTPYVETELLLAVMEEDEPRIEELLDEMLLGEMRTLHRQARRLASRLEERGA